MKAAASRASSRERSSKAQPGHGSPRGTPKRQAGAYKETELLQRIGQGTYGSVFRGMCNGEEVAVKVMPLQSDTAEDIKREIKIMRECACDYIIAYRDAFIREHEMRSTLWVVMEFCRVGSTLDVMRRQGSPLSEPQSAWVIRGMRSNPDPNPTPNPLNPTPNPNPNPHPNPNPNPHPHPHPLPLPHPHPPP